MKAARKLRIWQRDNWTCRMPECLCPDGRAVDPQLVRTDGDWAPTVDHVIPRREGGRDSNGNLRTAHRKCNNLAGNTAFRSAGAPESGRKRPPRPRLAYFDAFPQMERQPAGSVYRNPDELRRAWAANRAGPGSVIR